MLSNNYAVFLNTNQLFGHIKLSGIAIIEIQFDL